MIFPSREVEVLSAMFEHQLIGEFPLSYFDTVDWADRLSKWIVMLGLTEGPDSHEERFLVEALVNEFKGHSFAEIELALKMSIMDEFPEPIEAYNRLNFKFLAKVMKQFRIFRKNVANRYEEVRFKLEKKPRPIPTALELDMVTGSQVHDDYIRSLNKIDIISYSTKPELLRKLGMVSSEEITTIAIDLKKQVLVKDIDRIYNKEEKNRVEALQNNEQALNIHVGNAAKEQVYRKYIRNLILIKMLPDDLADILNAAILKLHEDTLSPPPPNE